MMQKKRYGKVDVQDYINSQNLESEEQSTMNEDNLEDLVEIFDEVMSERNSYYAKSPESIEQCYAELCEQDHAENIDEAQECEEDDSDYGNDEILEKELEVELDSHIWTLSKEERAEDSCENSNCNLQPQSYNRTTETNNSIVNTQVKSDSRNGLLTNRRMEMNTEYISWAKINNLYFPMSRDNEIYTQSEGYIRVHEFRNGVADVSDGQHWGCIDCHGKLIVPIKYDTIETREYNSGIHILCGRDGVVFTGVKGYSGFQKDTVYTGVYDIYNYSGELLLGGFDECFYDDESRLYHFFFGRSWHIYDQDSCAFSAPKYSVSDNQGKWALLTEDFRFPFDFQTFPRWGRGGNCAGYSVKGQVVTHANIAFFQIAGDMFPLNMVESMKWTETNWGHNTMLIDFPGITLFDEIKTLNSNIIQCKKKNLYALLYVKERSLSKYYSYLKVIDDEYAFVNTGFSIGLIRFGIETVPCEFSYITKPVNGWSFLFKTYPYFPNSDKLNKLYCYIADVTKHRFSYEFRNCLLVGEDIDGDKICSELLKGFYKLFPVKDNSQVGLKSVCLKNPRILCSKEMESQFGQYVQEDIPKLKETHLTIEQRIDNEMSKIYWGDGFDMEKEKELKNRTYDDYEEHYSIMDALDGDPEAYWNID